MAERTCSIDGCTTQRTARGLCSSHYNRLLRYGDPLGVSLVHPRVPLEQRFWSKVNKTGLCWEWAHAKDEQGYGRFKMDGRWVAAHRVAWLLLRGPIPDGLEIDHLCRNHACLRPSHLEPVTHQENMRRSIVGELSRQRAASRTHCANGHPYNVANTYYPKGRSRQCRACSLVRNRRRRLRGLR